MIIRFAHQKDSFELLPSIHFQRCFGLIFTSISLFTFSILIEPDDETIRRQMNDPS